MDLEGHTGELLVWLNAAPKGLGVMYTAPSTDECPLGKLNITKGDSSKEALKNFIWLSDSLVVSLLVSLSYGKGN